MTKTVHCGGTLQRVSLCTTMSAPKRTVGLATNIQFYTFPWGSPREAQPSPKTQLRRLGASAEVVMVAVQESRDSYFVARRLSVPDKSGFISPGRPCAMLGGLWLGGGPPCRLNCPSRQRLIASPRMRIASCGA